MNREKLVAELQHDIKNIRDIIIIVVVQPD